MQLDPEIVQFFEQAEHARLKRPCPFIIDLRNKVSACQAYPYKNKTFYMDSRSAELFQKGLQENNNVFTIGNYETILMNVGIFVPDTHINMDNTGQNETYFPDIQHFGYFSRRREHRLSYVMQVELQHNKKNYTVKTRDISVHGLQVFINALSNSALGMKKGETVRITFTKLVEQYTNSECFNHIHYRIVHVLNALGKTYITLQQMDDEDYTILNDYLSDFITKNRSRFRLDTTDTLLSAKAKLYEHAYTYNTPHVFYFISQKAQQYRVTNFAYTGKNADFFRFLEPKGQNIQLATFLIPQRLDKLVQLQEPDNNALLMLYWEKEKLFSVYDFEVCPDTLTGLIHYILLHEEYRIYKVTVQQVRQPDGKKLQQILSQIPEDEAHKKQFLLEDAQQVVAQILLADVSKLFAKKNHQEKTAITREQRNTLQVWSKYQLIRLYDKKVLKEYAEEEISYPDIIHFGYRQQRREPRYTYTMKVAIKLGEKVYSAQTIDFSTTGVGVLLTTSDAIPTINTKVIVNFSELMRKKVSVDLSNVHFQLSFIKQNGKTYTLGLRRLEDECDKAVNQFFIDLIKRNSDKLPVCDKEQRFALTASIYESIIAENMEPVPCFFVRDLEDGKHLRTIGLNEKTGVLCEYFNIRQAYYDFSILTIPSRLKNWFKLLSQSRKKQSMLYLYTQFNKQGQKVLFSKMEEEFTSVKEKKSFLKQLYDNQGACLLVSFVNHLNLNKQEIDTAIDMVMKISPNHATLLRKDYNELMGFAELLDITPQIRLIEQQL